MGEREEGRGARGGREIGGKRRGKRRRKVVKEEHSDIKKWEGNAGLVREGSESRGEEGK